MQDLMNEFKLQMEEKFDIPKNLRIKHRVVYNDKLKCISSNLLLIGRS